MLLNRNEKIVISTKDRKLEVYYTEPNTYLVIDSRTIEKAKYNHAIIEEGLRVYLQAGVAVTLVRINDG